MRAKLGRDRHKGDIQFGLRAMNFDKVHDEASRNEGRWERNEGYSAIRQKAM